MKKRIVRILIAALTVMTMTLIFTGCAEVDESDEIEDQTLETIVEELCEDIDVPAYETIRLDETNFESYSFIPYDDSLSAVAADALVNITPHSLVVIHSDGGNGEELAEQVLKNADPNKWLCVRSEDVQVAHTDHYIVLIMSDASIANAVVANFQSIAKDLDGMDMILVTAN